MTRSAGGAVLVVGVVGWIGLIWLATRMFATTPPTAAFDLELLLRAGRDVAAGRSPYDAAIVAGAAPVAERLFYSYPPIVAQVLAMVSGVPSGWMFAAWSAAALGAFAAVAAALAGTFRPVISRAAVAVTVVALAPVVFPWAIGLLFGNLDVFFPALYGLLLLGVVAGTPRATALAGIATAVATLTKLHPASLGLWLGLRVARTGATTASARVLAAAVVVGGGALAVSIALAPDLWREYLAVVRAGSGADLVDPRNAGPAALGAMAVLGGGPGAESLARSLQVVVALLAATATALAAWRLDDPVESLAVAAVASLVILPVTWFHYPSALLPFALVALLRSGEPDRRRRTTALVVAAAIVAALALAWVPLLWVAVGLVLAAVRASAAPGPGVPLATEPAPG